MKLRVLTFNIQHCRSYVYRDEDRIDFDLFADTIRCFDPDIVGLNEVRGEGTHPAYTAQAQILAEKLGYHYYFYPALNVCGYGLYGNAILSKHPILNPEIIPIPDPVRKQDGKFYETRCVAKAEFALGGGLTVLVTHFGLNPEEAQNAADTVCAAIDHAKTPVILTGDFNLRPDNPLLDPIRQRMTDTEDYFRCPGLMSYPSDRPYEKIDYVFTSPSVKVEFATIPQMEVSDHRPLFAVVEIPD
jgi:endonuclease/exonuclease/phosphatase family metal-dependent hydrolase